MTNKNKISINEVDIKIISNLINKKEYQGIGIKLSSNTYFFFSYGEDSFSIDFSYNEDSDPNVAAGIAGGLFLVDFGSQILFGTKPGEGISNIKEFADEILVGNYYYGNTNSFEYNVDENSAFLIVNHKCTSRGVIGAILSSSTNKKYGSHYYDQLHIKHIMSNGIYIYSKYKKYQMKDRIYADAENLSLADRDVENDINNGDILVRNYKERGARDGNMKH